MQALEVGHFRGIAGFDQGFETGLHQRGGAAAEHGLLTEQIGFGLFLEAGLDDAGAAAAVGGSVGQRDLLGLAGRILVDADQAGHAAALGVGAAHQVTGALRRDHDHVQIGTRLDQLEVDVEAVREGQRAALLEVGGNAVLVDLPLVLVGSEDHHQVGALHRFGDFLDLEAGTLGLGPGLGALAQTDGDIDSTVLEVLRMGVALRTVTEDDDLLRLDDRKVGVLVVIDVDAHCGLPLWDVEK